MSLPGSGASWTDVATLNSQHHFVGARQYWSPGNASEFNSLRRECRCRCENALRTLPHLGYRQHMDLGCHARAVPFCGVAWLGPCGHRAEIVACESPSPRAVRGCGVRVVTYLHVCFVCVHRGGHDAPSPVVLRVEGCPLPPACQTVETKNLFFFFSGRPLRLAVSS